MLDLFTSVLLYLVASGSAATLSLNPSAATTTSIVQATSTITVQNKKLAPDGYSRDTVVANGVFPAPPLIGYKGGKFELTVKNQLSDTAMDLPTSIHWHGLFQKSTNYQDGVDMVTQCPIIPGHSYEYKFSVPDQAGTFWYHSHYKTQYCDGLRGPLIIYDTNDPHASLYDVDDLNTIVTLADWYHIVSPLETLGAGAVALPDATLINGKGRSLETLDADLAVITVTKGKRYRMRLVAIACHPNWIWSIDSHTMTVIEVDGVNVQPYTVDSIQIYAAQRYSFILNANQPVNNYWIRAVSNLTPVGTIGGLNSAILRYSGAPAEEPTTSDISSNRLNEQALKPLTAAAVPGSATKDGADVNINLDIEINPLTLHFTVNGDEYERPSVPVLLQILNGANASELLPKGSVFYVPKNKVIQVSFTQLVGAVGGPHPMHLHGHQFSVIRSASNSSYNYIDPPVRDTVSAGTVGDLVTIRFTTDNPGPWLLHCHIDWHFNAGLAIVFAEDPADTPTVDAPTTQWKDLCPVYDSYIAS
ncbi:laccase [Punctularia strigosozonata HHB-11173 SS5]|uniref:Laccase n=1 Tax=Punctularia strigosozonata (strain HHB-11173) TaxID=741275 RepID=R7S4G7_PUNST|nr:laccase [Punctularia strigosozonata HHB-11173 SS5]EIN05270.1 laccase [Punctularia strigosozonata HHB-11173 SS5]